MAGLFTLRVFARNLLSCHLFQSFLANDHGQPGASDDHSTLSKLHLQWNEVKQCADDRAYWQQLVAALCSPEK